VFFQTLNELVLPEAVVKATSDNLILQAYLRNLLAGQLFYLALGSLWSMWIYYLFVDHHFPGGKGIPPLRLQLETIFAAVKSMFLYVLLPTLTEYVIENNMTRAYDYTTKMDNWPVMVVHIFFFMLSCEFMIYWIHRFLHDFPLLFKYLHHTHHLYNRPNMLSPWASVAFNPIDGLLQACPYLINLFLIPIEFHVHMALLFATAIWATSIHDTVIIPNTFPIMGSKYHLKHHTYYNCNYGQYTIFMDYLFGTLIEQSTAPNCKEEEDAKIENTNNSVVNGNGNHHNDNDTNNSKKKQKQQQQEKKKK